MKPPLSDNRSVDDLAEDFARRFRDGERPLIEDYARRFPNWAGEIRDLFPMILMMEDLKPRSDEAINAAPSLSRSPVPNRLGEYRILREIGRGGMGVVYEALQETLGRRVAIKVLPEHLVANEKLRARFLRESQAAARLHHTNIVPVFGVGEQGNICFYVMQLISGKNIETALEQEESGAKPTEAPEAAHLGQDTSVYHTPTSDNGLTPAAPQIEGPRQSSKSEKLSHHRIAQVGFQVADALAYAHNQGVLHRDIKPSNLLIDDQGTVWVTDFGVAKLREEASLTQSGDFVGTLRYMPPERFHGQSDARGDVYGLGVTLYEMLVRRPAFQDTTPQHLIQLITQTGLPSPRKADPTIPIDLETIVMKAVARDPEHRYPSARAFADDLRRLLEDRPVRARRVGFVERAWRWCRRNRTVASLAALAFGLLIITCVVLVVAYRRTWDAFDTEQRQREHAEKTSASALEALNRIYVRFAPNRIVVTPLLASDGTSDSAVDLPPQPILSPDVVPLLEELLGFYEQFARECSDYPRLREQAAEANQRIGDIRQRLGQLEPAITAYNLAIDLYKRQTTEPNDENARIRLARTYNELGRALRALQRTTEANEALLQALQTLEATSQGSALPPEHRYELARTYYLQAQREFLNDPMPGPPPGPRGEGPPDRETGGRGPDRPGAGDHGGPSRQGEPNGPRPGPGGRGGPPPRGPGEVSPTEKAVNILETLVKEHPNVPEYQLLLACCFRDQPPQRGPGGPDGSGGSGGRGGVPGGPGGRGGAGGRGGFPAEKRGGERAIELLSKLVQDFPKVPDYRYELCETLTRVGFFQRLNPQDGLPDGPQMLRDAVKLSGELMSQYPSVPLYTASHANALDKLGVKLLESHQLDDAENSLTEAVKLQSGLVRQHPKVVAYGFALSMMQTALGRIYKDAAPGKRLWLRCKLRTTDYSRSMKRTES